MLKRKAFNRIFVTTVIAFIAFITYSLNIPKLDNNTKNYETKNSVTKIYTVNKDNYVSMTEVFLENTKAVEDKIKKALEIMVVNNNKNALLPSYFNPILPKNTKINDVIVENDIIKIYFSKELININEEQSEKMIESITHTLLEFKGITGIEIYVENNLLKYVPNTKKELPTILTKEYGINKSYDLTSNMDIKKINLYYYTKNEDKLHLIPVTKYLNDKREKIEIIVEELSSYIYHDDLISMLSNNIELVNYQINNKRISLNFNKNIYEDEKKEISDIIIEPLLYSIFANYNINTIEISVDDIKILEKNKKNIEI